MIDTSEVLAEIRSRGYWRVVIRPTVFDERRIPEIASLFPIVDQSRVRLRGWDYPHVNQTEVRTLLGFVEQASSWEHHLEAWRFFQSAQFVHYSGLADDWRDRSARWPPDSKWAPGRWLGIGSVIYRFTEIFEFAARLAQAAPMGDAISIATTVVGLKDRLMYADDPQRLDLASQRAHVDIAEFPFGREASRADLMATPRAIALDACKELFSYCHVDMSDSTLRSWQDEVGRGFGR